MTQETHGNCWYLSDYQGLRDDGEEPEEVLNHQKSGELYEAGYGLPDSPRLFPPVHVPRAGK
jgi:hypothetical protein